MRAHLVVPLLAAAAALLPLLLHLLLVGQVPSLSPFAASDLLRAEGGNAVLIDVREAQEFAAAHLDGSVSWPLPQIAASRSIPPQFSGKHLLLICSGGVASAKAVRLLHALGAPEAAHVAGGLQSWIAAAEEARYPAIAAIRLGSGAAVPLPYKESPLWQQLTAFAAGFVLKPLYMLITGAMIVLLARRQEGDLVLLRRGLVFFLAGEAACSVNYLFFSERSDLAEYLHSLGMIFGIAFLLRALLEGADARLIRHSCRTERCAAFGSLCRACAKHAPVPCAAQRLFLLLSAALLLLSALPLAAQPRPVSYNTTILGGCYNYTHALVQQLFEIRFAPAAAACLLGLSCIAPALPGALGAERAKPLFALGAGYLLFSILRAALLHLFANDMLWFVFWEEATELLLILGILCVLLLFRSRLLAAGPDVLWPQLFGDAEKGALGT